jgi:nucleotide-binding universal stress UspA family protein
MNPETPRYRIARDDFRNARRQAKLQEITNRLTGRSSDLLPFEEVRKKLKASGGKHLGLQRIPLDSIIGSVGRYTDFTRDFLPRSDASANRWVRVKARFRNLQDMPPIQVYKIGEAYFVLDGNHRVSIARERKAVDIRAYVTEISTKVPITPDADLDDLIIKSEYTEFLEKTHLDELRPQSDLTITVPGRYYILEDQITHSHQQRQDEKGQEIPYPEAVLDWYDNVYFPVIKVIRGRGILRDFPNRTETDLYVWITRHQETLKLKLGWNLEPTVAATDLTDRHGARLPRIISRYWRNLRKVIVPAPMETGPRPGVFRKRQQEVHAHDPAHLFTHMLMPLSGEGESWKALDFGIRLAWREEAHLLGLHILPKNADISDPRADAIRERFEQRCREVGLPGELSIETGNIVPTIIKRAYFSDLVIIHLAHPPENHPINRMESGIRKLIQRCPRPILTIPDVPQKLERLLVAYNGNPKAIEALYAAAYFAGRWEVPLFVLTVAEPNKVDPKIITHARYYLRSHGIKTTFVQEKGNIADTILETAKNNDIDLIFMGGYSRSPLIEVVLGSSLNAVLAKSHIPVLICR